MNMNSRYIDFKKNYLWRPRKSSMVIERSIYLVHRTVIYVYAHDSRSPKYMNHTPT